MFVLSMKTNRTYLAILIAVGGLLLAMVLGAAALPAAPAGAAVTADPAAYLQSLGYEAEEPWTALREVTLPTRDDPTFAAVNAVAQAAGYDLVPYAGQRVKCYTYAVRNHPDNQPAEADIYVYQSRVVAATMRVAGGDPIPLKTLTKQGETHGTTG